MPHATSWTSWSRRPEVDALARRPLPAPRSARPAVSGPDATIVERHDVSPSVVRLRVRPDAGVPAFEPGQYVALGLEMDGRLVQRPYSIASARGETDALELLVRLVPGGALTPHLWPLGPGARLRMGRPRGLFTESAGEARRPIYVATGTGIAPLVAMLETRLREREDGPADRRPVVVHGVARARDLAYHDRLAALAAMRRITYVPAVSRPGDAANAAWSGAVGRVDAVLQAVLDLARVDVGAAVAYLCGNPGMTDAATSVLLALGMAAEAVRTEAYWSPAQAAPAA